MEYTGELSPSQGVYRSSSFRDEDEGQDTVLLVTQLEQTGARHMFPCIDEPSSKVKSSSYLKLPQHEELSDKRPSKNGGTCRSLVARLLWSLVTAFA